MGRHRFSGAAEERKMRPLATVVIGLLVPIVVGNAALAGPRESAPGSSNVHVHNYADRACIRWTDGCRRCSREGETSICSNIGIACQPGRVVCTARRDDPKKD
jgi:hypothetical protein